MSKIIYKIKPIFILCLILFFSFIVYLPGLSGDYVFDDIVNIIDNKKIAILSLNYLDLKAAWYAGDAGPLGRPISMLSFALNYYFTGFNPYYFKLTNLFIHLINGFLVFIIGYKLFQWLSVQYHNISLQLVPYLACLVSLIWLIHPLNLTSVLYVVQRMTSLSALFGLLALAIYCVWRTRTITGLNTILALCGITLSLLASILSKESGILFIPLIYWVELVFFQAKNLKFQPIYVKKIKLIHMLLGGVIVAGLVFLYLLPPYLNPANFARREFTLVERLLTESRVIFYYLKMTFYPLLSDLSLYHDDFAISKSITQPITTLYSLVGLLGITLVCIVLVKKHPMLLFAWGWYVISQLLESTFISLELIHEHRNYFGIIGFIFTAVYYIAQINNKKIQPFLYGLGALYILNLAWTTWQRSEIWSNLVDHAVYEATMHPRSDRANYQLARIYMKLMQLYPENQEEYAALASKSLLKAKQSYYPANGAWFAELHLNSYLKRPIKQQTIDELIWRLKNEPFQNNNISFLSAFTTCQIDNFCHVPHDQAVQIIAAGIQNKGVDNKLQAEIYKLLVQYYIGVIADFKKGEEFIEHAIQLHEDVNGRLIFSQVYRLQNKLTQAEEQIQRAKQIDTENAWEKEITIEQHEIDNAISSKKKVVYEN
ncbi:MULTISPECIES: hypothetical protein [unclassified Acinetobacter]|uniref:hypothetical protein n=1 Tax=unclassified Acinetobacter TaxID=196816 RepID=UPI0025779E4E|nr:MULTISPECIES: hypothetical protein [unclassified Acinetobacter]MDM1764124.1 hypothetical protein [Acinetobacter sp. 226-1]MDM1769055.1 hypothetical protein [Acinetobacter sp. 226-4]